MRSHWAKRRKLQKEWEGRVWCYWHQAGQPMVRGPVAMEAVRWYAHPHRALDPTNLAACFKMPEDALVRCGAIEDDSARIIVSMTTMQERVESKAQEGISFTVRPTNWRRPK